MTVLAALQAELSAATNQLLATAASLSDSDVHAPSLLPGWTRGHVLTHVARSGDSYVNLLTWARTGVRTPQYASSEARAAEIEATAARPAAWLLADLEDGAARFAAAVRDMSAPAWSATVEGLRPPPHPAWYVLVRRLREVGFHHVDLAAGYGPADWPDSFVRRELHDCVRTWPPGHAGIGRLRQLIADGPAVEGTPHDLLAWLTGRSGGEGVSLLPVGQSHTSDPGGASLPEPPPWLSLTAPADLPATPPKDYP
ncbi:maleylpyruvate isomerase family mycothiol-dependent enzyme [Nonomuraea sp. MG754425]|uniref:maleylpyruvate isomerase family mycothiol-dependent enzyme n=1 Tax=Nonomuraea sp. MG754425 TaxID=2570319 RepID=UPI001EFFCF04|nr:maleylpyruvate isomerase family mycothiol-dependent enzyme [Nonomuraea sp. MG754425]MCF6470884.1 maleylpyruvate isomerase family mycothiol-dependent enzyme [Nonomuraea sp. MG754425]